MPPTIKLPPSRSHRQPTGKPNQVANNESSMIDRMELRSAGFGNPSPRTNIRMTAKAKLLQILAIQRRTRMNDGRSD